MVHGNNDGSLRWSSPVAKELGNLPFVQICADGKVSRRSERTEHQEDVVVVDKIARQIQGDRRIGFIIT
jgi:hypothetical protein